MDFNEYSIKSGKVLLYPKAIAPLYLALGVNGEAGEVGEKVKKVYRDKEGIFSSQSTEEIKKEIGDVLWYLNRLSVELGFTLEEAAILNLLKIEDRINREVVQSKGDNR